MAGDSQHAPAHFVQGRAFVYFGGRKKADLLSGAAAFAAVRRRAHIAAVVAIRRRAHTAAAGAVRRGAHIAAAGAVRRGAHAPAGLTAHAAAAVDEALERDVSALAAHGDGAGAALRERRSAHDDAGIGLRGRELRESTRTPTAGWPSSSTAIRSCTRS